MRTTADVVVIGGGIAGTSTAFHLAKKGIKNVVVVERQYTPFGGTGRCGSGFRETWGSVTLCKLNTWCIEKYKNFQDDTSFDRDIEMIQDGYMFTVHEQADHDMMMRNLELQHTLGIPSVVLTPEEGKKIVPYLNIDDGMISCFYNERDGHANPFLAALGYKYAAERMGVEFNNYTEVTGIETKEDKITAVVTNKGTISTNCVVNACGPYAKYISQMMGLSLPYEPEKHEILVTEPYEYDWGKPGVPMIYSYKYGTYISHLSNGTFLMGWGDINVHTGHKPDWEQGWSFLDIMAKNCVAQCPPLAKVRVIRQWAGHYGITPDNQPVIGPDTTIEGYNYALGASKAFMLGPAIGTTVAEKICGDSLTLPEAEELSVDRFRTGKLLYDFAYV